jgi:S1-C subfamily serine protease
VALIDLLPTERNVVNPSRSRTTLLLAALLAALGIGAGVGATTFAVLSDDSEAVAGEVTTVTEPDPEPAEAPNGLSVGTIYRNSERSVVEITTASGPAEAQGSGFVYDDAGHVVTNQHVVQNASAINVRFSDGSTRRAEVVGTDPSTDLAVLKVDAPSDFLEPLQLGDSSEVGVGDPVVAMGSPFGLEGTVTSGIVSALHRQIEAPNTFTIADTIQTDAAINHGNSGGPLLDNRGRVIGVNAQIESESGGSDGVGFAIPSNTVRSVVSQIIDTGEAEHAYLGVQMADTPDGIVVTEVRAGGPADDAGVCGATGTRSVEGRQVPTGGDVILEFDGQEIASSEELQSAVEARQPGDTVELTVLRDGDRRTLDVTLAERPDDPGSAGAADNCD